jgi:hypothetical protein
MVALLAQAVVLFSEWRHLGIEEKVVHSTFLAGQYDQPDCDGIEF